MAKNSRPEHPIKRAREKAPGRPAKKKRQRRTEARERKASAHTPRSRRRHVDPDIADIRPGPQPRPDWLEDLEEEKEEETASEGQ